MISLLLEPTDKQPLTPALPGQFVVLRLRPASDAPLLMRSYSLSGELSAERYRVSVKREAHGTAGIYIDDELQVGDLVDASAARGSFTLRPGNTPVILLSAGIGATPLLAMLHALAAEGSTRESGGYTGPAAAASIRLPGRRAACSKCWLTATATFDTARPIPRIGPV